MLEWLAEYMTNYVKQRRYVVKNDIPPEIEGEFLELSRLYAQRANDIYAYNHL